MSTDDFPRPMGVTGPGREACRRAYECDFDELEKRVLASTLSGDVMGLAERDGEEVRDIFRDGASPELEARMAYEDLMEALEPEACPECGHRPEPDQMKVEQATLGMGEAMHKLPPGQYRDDLKALLFGALYGAHGSTLRSLRVEVPRGALKGTGIRSLLRRLARRS